MASTTADEIFDAALSGASDSLPAAPKRERHKNLAQCERCGDEFNRWPKNRKYCGACQALRDLDFRPNMKRTCEVCEETFYPFRTGHTRCANCTEIRERPELEPCTRCGKRKRTAPGLANTCISCVSSTPKAQLAYHRALAKVQLPKQRAWAERSTV